METVEIKIIMNIDDNAYEEIKKLEHHAEYLLDLESYPEIKAIYGCKVRKIEEER